MNDSDLFESSANLNKENCVCGHHRDHHDHDCECYYSEFPSGATGCLCEQFVSKTEGSNKQNAQSN